MTDATRLQFFLAAQAYVKDDDNDDLEVKLIEAARALDYERQKMHRQEQEYRLLKKRAGNPQVCMGCGKLMDMEEDLKEGWHKDCL